MDGWRVLRPALLRGVGLFAGAIALRLIAAQVGQPVDWLTAALYGVALGLAMRWPVILPTTGVRLVLVTGLLFEAIWRFGLLTGIAVLLIEFGVRMLAIPNANRFWDWNRPVIAISSLSLSWLLAQLVAEPDRSLWLGLPTDLSAFVLAFTYWFFINLVWSWLKAPNRKRVTASELLQSFRQTVWVPLLSVAVGWLLSLVQQLEDPVTLPVVLALIWVQRLVGPVFTTMHQDRAVSMLVRLAPNWHSPSQRSQAQRVMRVAYALGRSLRLSTWELRTVGYAAMLQGIYRPTGGPLPLWYDRPLGPEERSLVQEQTERAAKLIEEDGVLQDVANLVRYRYTAYDGSGYPAVIGDAIGPCAEVLSAANALVYLTDPAGRNLTPDQAVEWIREHAQGRFSRWVLSGMLAITSEMERAASESEGLPQAIRQLQELVGGPAIDSPLRLGLRRVMIQLRSQLKLAPELPGEVQAVARFSTILASSKDLDQTAQLLTRSVGQLMGAKVALALKADQAGDLEMRFQAVHDFQQVEVLGRTIAVQGGYMSRALLGQEPTQLTDLQEANSPLAHEIARLEGVRSVLFVPLVNRGRPIGLLMVGLTRHHWFTPREVGLIHLMADLAATALEKDRLLTELEERIHHISKLKSFTDTLLDNLPEAIIVVDPDGLVTLSNAAAGEILGCLEQKGKPLSPELTALFPAERALAGASLQAFDLPWRSRVLSVLVKPLRDRSGFLLGAVCLAHDVTQVRSMEERSQRLEKLAAIAELAAGAAHEIRNPLTSIRGFMQLLQAQGRDGQAEYFQIMLNEIDRIDAIIRDLLLLAKPSLVQRKPTNLAAVVDEVLLLNRSELERKGIQIHRRVDVSGSVLLDPQMFRQLLLNLLINAVQAMPGGGKLALMILPTGADEIALKVVDTGVGILPDNLKRLFDPFFTTKEEGTGLGLALCHTIVQAHGGQIEVESEVGLGTTFTITLQAPASI